VEEALDSQNHLKARPAQYQVWQINTPTGQKHQKQSLKIGAFLSLTAGAGH
jgi:hypothetical protein